jgi:hypothetical protein
MAFLREVQCHNCGWRTRHLNSTIQRIIQLQSASFEGDAYINYACPSCNNLTRSRVEPGGKIYEGVDLSRFSDGLTVYAVYLECVKTGCKFPVILLAPVKSGILAADLLTHIQTNWNTHGALCAENFPSIHPYDFRIWKKLEP